MDRGSLGALNYSIPLNQQQTQGAPQQGMAPSQVSLPPMDNDPIAVRERLTADYYNNYAQLKSFLTDMSKKGIDATTPKYDEDGGGAAFQVYQKMLANQMYASNLLKNELEKEKQLQPYLYTNKASLAPGFNMQEDLLTESPDAVVSNEPLPFVEEANRRSREKTYTAGDTQRLNQASVEPALARISEMEAAGQLSPQEANVQRANLFRAVQDTSYQQLIPRGSGSGRGLSKEDVSRRAELIKQVKSGILTGDQTALNILRQAPSVRSVDYINSGDRVGIQVSFANGDPAFIDLSQGAGEGEINAFLNRIEGQKNVPNEAVFTFDTKVDIPQSNVGPIVQDITGKLQAVTEDIDANEDLVEKLNSLAVANKLSIPEGKVVEVSTNSKLFGPNQIVVKYYPKDGNGNISYKGKRTKKITNPDEIAEFVRMNATQIAPEFGGGFTQDSQPTQLPEMAPAEKALYDFRIKRATPTQVKALEAFRKQFSREPSPTELKKLIDKYK